MDRCVITTAEHPLSMQSVFQGFLNAKLSIFGQHLLKVPLLQNHTPNRIERDRHISIKRHVTKQSGASYSCVLRTCSAEASSSSRSPSKP